MIWQPRRCCDSLSTRPDVVEMKGLEMVQGSRGFMTVEVGQISQVLFLKQNFAPLGSVRMTLGSRIPERTMQCFRPGILNPRYDSAALRVNLMKTCQIVCQNCIGKHFLLRCQLVDRSSSFLLYSGQVLADQYECCSGGTSDVQRLYWSEHPSGESLINCLDTTLKWYRDRTVDL